MSEKTRLIDTQPTPNDIERFSNLELATHFIKELSEWISLLYADVTENTRKTLKDTSVQKVYELRQTTTTGALLINEGSFVLAQKLKNWGENFLKLFQGTPPKVETPTAGTPGELPPQMVEHLKRMKVSLVGRARDFWKIRSLRHLFNPNTKEVPLSLNSSELGLGAGGFWQVYKVNEQGREAIAGLNENEFIAQLLGNDLQASILGRKNSLRNEKGNIQDGLSANESMIPQYSAEELKDRVLSVVVFRPGGWATKIFLTPPHNANEWAQRITNSLKTCRWVQNPPLAAAPDKVLTRKQMLANRLDENDYLAADATLIISKHQDPSTQSSQEFLNQIDNDRRHAIDHGTYRPLHVQYDAHNRVHRFAAHNFHPGIDGSTTATELIRAFYSAIDTLQYQKASNPSPDQRAGVVTTSPLDNTSATSFEEGEWLAPTRTFVSDIDVTTEIDQFLKAYKENPGLLQGKYIDTKILVNLATIAALDGNANHFLAMYGKTGAIVPIICGLPPSVKEVIHRYHYWKTLKKLPENKDQLEHAHKDLIKLLTLFNRSFVVAGSTGLSSVNVVASIVHRVGWLSKPLEISGSWLDPLRAKLLNETDLGSFLMPANPTKTKYEEERAVLVKGGYIAYEGVAESYLESELFTTAEDDVYGVVVGGLYTFVNNIKKIRLSFKARSGAEHAEDVRRAQVASQQIEQYVLNLIEFLSDLMSGTVEQLEVPPQTAARQTLQ